MFLELFVLIILTYCVFFAYPFFQIAIAQVINPEQHPNVLAAPEKFNFLKCISHLHIYNTTTSKVVAGTAIELPFPILFWKPIVIVFVALILT